MLMPRVSAFSRDPPKYLMTHKLQYESTNPEGRNLETMKLREALKVSTWRRHTWFLLEEQGCEASLSNKCKNKLHSQGERSKPTNRFSRACRQR